MSQPHFYQGTGLHVLLSAPDPRAGARQDQVSDIRVALTVKTSRVNTAVRGLRMSPKSVFSREGISVVGKQGFCAQPGVGGNFGS